MRLNFQEQLDELTDRLASMCHLAEQAIEAATDALTQADLPTAEKVFDLNEQIEALRGPCEEQAMALLALQAPVARDLRQVVTGVHLVTDLSRMGGLAQHVAESVRRRHPAHVAAEDPSHCSPGWAGLQASWPASRNRCYARTTPSWPPNWADETTNSTLHTTNSST